jgi:hypothetical protein
VAINSGGYEGDFSNVDWAMQAPFLASGAGRHQVLNSTSLQVVKDPNVTRGVIVKAGSCWGDGVLDVLTADLPLAFDAVTSSTRYGAVVVRRDWTRATPTSAVTGTSIVPVNTGLATTPTKPSGLNATPGTKADQVLALVPITAGQAAVGTILDRRTDAESPRVITRKRASTDGFNTSAPGLVEKHEQWRPAGEYELSGQAVFYNGNTIPTAGGSLVMYVQSEGGSVVDLGGLTHTLSASFRTPASITPRRYAHTGGVLTVWLYMIVSATSHPGWQGFVEANGTVTVAWRSPNA